MGIRHQVYVRLEPDKYEDTDNRSNLIGVHIQVCDGYDALQLLCNLIDFNHYNKGIAFSSRSRYFNTNLYYVDKELTAAEKVLISLHSACPVTGFYSLGTSLLCDDVIKNPNRGDNNSGITIVDLSKRDAMYCFMRLNKSESALDVFETVQPISAEDYIHSLAYIEEQNSYDKDPVWNEQHKQMLLEKISHIKLLTLQLTFITYFYE